MMTESVQLDNPQPKARKKLVLNEETILDLQAKAFPKSTAALFPDPTDPDPEPDDPDDPDQV